MTMQADLIKALRTCSPTQRSSIAIELGRIGTQEAVTELKRIAKTGECTPPKWCKKHWYSTATEIHSECSFESQLIAIAGLGESKSKIALDFIKRFGEWRLGERTTAHCLGGDVGTGVYDLYFKYATGPLQYRLEV